jgi:hypothetical protein
MDSDAMLYLLLGFLPVVALVLLSLFKKENRKPERLVKVFGAMGGGLILALTVALFASPDLRELVFGAKPKPSAENNFIELFRSGSLLPNQLQPKLMFKDMESVRRLLGPPDKTMEGDRQWYYDNKVTHPITGKIDCLIIQFDSDATTDYIQAGIGGQHWSLK